MSAGDILLVFLDGNDRVDRWMRVSGGRVAARGILSDVDPAGASVVAAVPGDAVTIRWIELPSGLSPAQAAAAAKLQLAQTTPEPMDQMHVVAGPAEVDGSRAVAMVRKERIEAWLAALRERGLRAEKIIPEPLLLPEPEQGFYRHDRGPLPVFRGKKEAFAVEADIAGAIVPAEAVETLGPMEFERGIPAALSKPVIDLRQGAFTRRREWKVELPEFRRAGMLLGILLLVTLGVQLAQLFRYTYAADQLEQKADEVRRQAVPGTAPGNARQRLDQRLVELGAKASYGRLAPALFQAVRATPDVELTSVDFGANGVARATVAAASPANISALQRAVEAGGLSVQTTPVRTQSGRPTAQMVVRQS